ncbi:MAG: hypothetical protein M3468_10590 [Acidobacteriota bacterium]|nr:hypothetical protein [Acidobacteriota bacterium]
MKRLYLSAALYLCTATVAAGQTVTSIGTRNVKAAQDFATRAFQDPWDMQQRTDFGAFLDGTDQPRPNFSGISFANGVFSATSSNDDPSVFLLETGNPFAARIGKTGSNFPIDANTYKVLAMRMSVNHPTSQMQLFWNRDSIFDYSLTVATPNFFTSPGFRTYLIDLTQQPFSSLGAAGFQWGGTVRTLRFDPTNQAGVEVQIDWARLVSVDASLCRTITWSGGGSTVNIYLIDAATGANLGPIALSAVATSGSANSASAGCSTSGSGYKFYAGALAPGTYKVGVVTAGGTLIAANISSDTWAVNDVPTLGFVTPSPEGGDDFATMELGNPWDMAALSDVDMFRFINGPAIQTIPLQSPAGFDLGPRTVLTGTSIAGPEAGTADPHFGVLWNPGRGAGKRIDPTKYRILTVDMGVQDFARNINEGAVMRVAWRVAGNDACGESVTDDIIFTSRAGANVVNTLTMDLADRTMVAIEEGCPDGWVRGSAPNPGLDLFRIDPHEYTPATPFFVSRVKLAAYERVASSYNISWDFSDSGTSTVDLYYDTDNANFDGTLIQANVPTSSFGSYSWNTTAVGAPSVYIYAIFRDNFPGGANENRVYAKWPIILSNNAAPEVSVNRPRINFGVANSSVITPSQTVRVNVTSGSPCWTVTNPTPSVFTVSPSSGNGNGSFTISAAASSYPPGFNQASTLTVGPCSGGAIANTATVAVTLRSHAVTSVPIGVLDTPANGALVNGSIAVTGWAIDDVGIAEVAIWRDPVAGEAAGLKFLGQATRVDDARADISAAFADSPFQYRGGWGYLLLTNFLPNQGDGNFRLHAYAKDLEGTLVALGSVNITAANSTSFKPFGAIDTPGQGETVSGMVNNFGWVLVRGSAKAYPPFGSVSAVIDGVIVGSPGVWAERPDIVAAFPESTYSGVKNAVGLYTFDSTAYANGVHTISWVVTADNGLADGIGSRYFNIQNASAALTSASANPFVVESPSSPWAGPLLGRSVRAAGHIDDRAAVRMTRGYGRTSLASGAELHGWSRLISMQAGERVRINVDGATEAYHVVDGRLATLPVGATFNQARGTLYWQPGPGFAGVHEVVLVREGKLVPVHVSLGSGSSRVAKRGKLFGSVFAME